MKELRNIPLWAMILSLCVAAAAATFVVIGLFHALTGAGVTQVFLDAVIAGALTLGAWSVAVKGNPALSKHRDNPPNRRSPLEW
ncbi:hypothetical protein SAMN04489740_2847 [Arthrobacter alpinus]|uniref:Uncharacterized protein n=1 Tax=Arthrobacter alpinus TaxID=656366 RepID=A0A0U3QK87_9MICC|nr:hypothetical protein MB46_17940 [Arthrobacter alpinus]SEE86582.1 hypothetical protein SAMN04489740_2847 [Arthrobacter alpinus]